MVRIAAVGLLGLAAVVVLVVHFPLDAATHRFGLPYAREYTKHAKIELGDMSFYLLDGLEIRDIRVGPPEGYTRDIFTAKRLLVRYDLTRLLAGELVVTDVLLDEPAVFLEVVDGKPNVVALLEKLPKSETPETPPSDPVDFTVVVGQIGARGLRLGFDDGARRMDFGRVDAYISGRVNPAKGGEIEVTVRVGDTTRDRDNLDLGAQPGGWPPRRGCAPRCG